MSKVELLRAVMKRRQTAAAEEIYQLFERTMAEYRGHTCSAGEHRPQTSRAGNDLTLIKEEHDELCISQEGEQLHEPVPVKSEEDEETAQSSQLHQRQTVGQMGPGADGEDCAGSEPGRRLRLLLKQRLSTAVDEIFGLFEATLAEYEEKIEGLHKLLGEAVKPEVQVNTADVLQLLVIKQELPSEQQEWRIILNQEDQEPQQPPHIKEEQEDLWSSKEEEQLHGLVAVKGEDDEETVQSSQLHHRQIDKQMETGADGEDCGASEPGRIFGPACDLQQESDENTSSSDPETENSDDYSQERSSPLSGLVTLKYNEDSVSQKEKLCGSDAVISMPNVKIYTGGKPFSCTFCGKGFGEKSELKRHVRFHTGEKPFSCILCEKTFTESADLKRHMRVHTGEKPFSCPICYKGFGEKTDVTRHIRVHTGEKPFSCSTCGKIFSQCVNLRRHERIHTGEKPFSCQVCAKKFTHRGGLVVHMRIHTGEKPFDCSVCGKSYRETGSLKKHMRVHTGEKPFSCSDCGRRFSNQSQVKSHKCSGESTATVVHHL